MTWLSQNFMIIVIIIVGLVGFVAFLPRLVTFLPSIKALLIPPATVTGTVPLPLPGQLSPANTVPVPAGKQPQDIPREVLLIQELLTIANQSGEQAQVDAILSFMTLRMRVKDTSSPAVEAPAT